MTLTFKNKNSKPLMLWCSSHATLSKEEIPLYLDAGFRVIPLLTDFWTFEYRKSLEKEICPDWKANVDLPANVVEKLQSISFCQDFGRQPIGNEVLDLLNKHVDAIYLTVLPNLAIRLTKSFDGSVVFRPFGHAELQTYSRIATAWDQPPSNLTPSSNFIWCPILSTLQCAEARSMWTTPVHVGCFVTRDRLKTQDWNASMSEPVVLETLPRIRKQEYYRIIYEEYIRDHGCLPLKILGGNEKNGGELNDCRIVGQLPDQEYHNAILSSRICIYHGKSPYHVHYHPLEFMAIGVPVLFHTNSAIAWEARFAGYSESFLALCGMYSTAEQANALAKQALDSTAYAEQLSQSQRFFLDSLFSRSKALQQAIWLKTVIISQINESKGLIPSPRVLRMDKPDLAGNTSTSHPTGGDTMAHSGISWGRSMERGIRKMKKKFVSRLGKAS